MLTYSERLQKINIKIMPSSPVLLCIQYFSLTALTSVLEARGSLFSNVRDEVSMQYHCDSYWSMLAFLYRYKNCDGIIRNIAYFFIYELTIKSRRNGDGFMIRLIAVKKIGIGSPYNINFRISITINMRENRKRWQKLQNFLT